MRCIYEDEDNHNNKIKMKNYIMIEGKKIALSDSTVEEFKKNFSLDPSIDEFVGIFDLKKPTYWDINLNILDNGIYKPYIVHIDKNIIMYIKLPNANNEWVYTLMDTCKEFCKRYIRYMDFTEGIAKAGYISIYLGKE